MPRPEILPIPCLRDNYCYLIVDPAGQDAWLVDPSEAGPPHAAVTKRGATLRGILATHHHYDHVDGIQRLCSLHADVWVAGHAYDRGRIPGQTVTIDAPKNTYITTDLKVAGHRLHALHIPGHTLGAIAWCIPADADGPADVFTGDTLFAAGCGRLFEGTPEMMLQSLRTLTKLPPASRLWFGHEYTAANLRFAETVEPENPAIQARVSSLGACTTPTTVGEERATNPFLRASSVEEMATRRAAKDRFRA